MEQSEIGQQRIQSFAFVIALAVCVLFSVGFAWKVVRAEQGYEIELESRINPNNALAASLVRLPGIGISRAQAIICYRQEYKRNEGRSEAFEKDADLQRVVGIGPKTVQNISAWMKF